MGLLDFFRIKSFDTPIYDDGGSGHYIGLGYSFNIKDNFMPENELPSVTEYTFCILGFEIKSGIRDDNSPWDFLLD